MRNIVKFAGLLAASYLGVVGVANAGIGAFDGDGDCGDALLGTRQINVSGADTSTPGLCYAQNGNFIGDDFSGIVTTPYDLLDKDIAPDGMAEGSLEYTGSTSGTWEIAAGLWGQYDQLFLAFHFGGGGSCGTGNNPPAPCDADPDSFLVELTFGVTSGTWALVGGSLNGLSNIYLIGHCTDEPCTPYDVPEPATLGLLGFGLAGLGFGIRRRRKI
jgi:hypothetical protein